MNLCLLLLLLLVLVLELVLVLLVLLLVAQLLLPPLLTEPKRQPIAGSWSERVTGSPSPLHPPLSPPLPLLQGEACAGRCAEGGCRGMSVASRGEAADSHGPTPERGRGGGGIGGR